MRISFTTHPHPTAAFGVKWGLKPDGKYWHFSPSTVLSYDINDMCGAPANSSTHFISPGSLHDALITGLKPESEVYYVVGSEVTGVIYIYAYMYICIYIYISE
jgi:hypothetical protein